MSELTKRAKAWLDEHATGSGAEIFLIREMCDALERAEKHDAKDYARYLLLKHKFERGK